MGRHEPPTNRSFYFSLGASTLRFLIIIALVIGGIVVIDQAFPAADTGNGATAPLNGGVEVTGATGETEPTGPTGETRQAPEPSPQVIGVRIAVFNGAGASGLAADTQTLLEEEGYMAVQDPADAPAPYPVTTIYYRAPKDEIEAEYLANSVFEELEDVEIARLEPGTANIDRSAQLAIFLGDDYATLTAE
ncbi:MAG TPA: LytR C-terminal domain-containing protein [Actinomycetota bacterium]|nr:LytR C-terminal domain-containing protein [Actinomycetota bacterium]